MCLYRNLGRKGRGGMEKGWKWGEKRTGREEKGGKGRGRD